MAGVAANSGQSVALGVRPEFISRNWRNCSWEVSLVPCPLQILASSSGNGWGDIDLLESGVVAHIDCQVPGREKVSLFSHKSLSRPPPMKVGLSLYTHTSVFYLTRCFSELTTQNRF